MNKNIKLNRHKKEILSFRAMHFALADESGIKRALQYLYREKEWIYSTDGRVLFASRLLSVYPGPDKIVFRPDVFFDSCRYVQEEGLTYPEVERVVPREETIKEKYAVGFNVPKSVYDGVILTITASGKCYFMGPPKDDEPHFTFNSGYL